jgi:hypothetical protein
LLAIFERISLRAIITATPTSTIIAIRTSALRQSCSIAMRIPMNHMKTESPFLTYLKTIWESIDRALLAILSTTSVKSQATMITTESLAL